MTTEQEQRMYKFYREQYNKDMLPARIVLAILFISLITLFIIAIL